MKVLVIVVTYNAMEWASRCFDSLLKSNRKVDVFIVDNGSSDGTQEFIKLNYPHFKFLQSKTNIGFGAANNLGMQYALDNDYDFVYLLNQDAWIFPDTIDLLIEASSNNPNFGILSPFQYCADEKKLDFGFEKILNKYCSSEYAYSSTALPVPFVMAAHWFIPITTIKKVGGFSPTFFHYGEDYNYIDRVFYHGLKVGVLPTAKAVHDREFRTLSKDKLLYMRYVRNLIRFSNPKKEFLYNSIEAIIFAIISCFKEISLKPIHGFFTQLKNINTIKNNRQISMQKEKAFL